MHADVRHIAILYANFEAQHQMQCTSNELKRSSCFTPCCSDVLFSNTSSAALSCSRVLTLMITYGTRSPTTGAVAGSRLYIFLDNSTCAAAALYLSASCAKPYSVAQLIFPAARWEQTYWQTLCDHATRVLPYAHFVACRLMYISCMHCCQT